VKKQQHRTFTITENFVQRLEPTDRDQLFFDETEQGFGVRLTKGGVVSFILNYRFKGRDRRVTLGNLPDRYWPRFKVKEARAVAKAMKAVITSDRDPLTERDSARRELTVGDLADLFIAHAELHRRPITVRDYKAEIRRIIRPRLGAHKISAVTRTDVQKLHSSLKTTPYYANRCLALVSAIWNYAKSQDPPLAKLNPAEDVEKFEETAREAMLTDSQVQALERALSNYPDQQAATRKDPVAKNLAREQAAALVNAIRLTLYTGARHSEITKAKWADFHLEASSPYWLLPARSTKGKKQHHIRLSQHALAAIQSLMRKDGAQYLFPGDSDGHRETLRKPWADIRKAAKLPKTFRLHDLRHNYASMLVSAGVPIYTVQKMIGHSQIQTTQRYAHLAPETLDEATSRADELFNRATGTVQ
jgi:integrase